MKIFAFIFLIIHTGHAAEIKVAAGVGPMRDFLMPIKESFEKKTGHHLILIEERPEFALRDLDNDLVDVAVAGINWKLWLELCDKKNINIDKNKPFHYSSIGRDKIKIYVNKNSKTAVLTKEDFKSIFTGKALNWRDVGGRNKKINIYVSETVPGTNAIFQQYFLLGESVRGNLIQVKNLDEITKFISKDPDGIGYAPDNIDFNKYDIKVASEKIAIDRPVLYVFLKPSPQVLELKKFIAGDEGQKLIKHYH